MVQTGDLVTGEVPTLMGSRLAWSV